MSVTAFIRSCLDAGVSIEVALQASEKFEAKQAEAASKTRSNGAERAARYRLRKAVKTVTKRDESVTNRDDVTVVTVERDDVIPSPSVSPRPPSTTPTPSILLRPLKGAHGSNEIQSEAAMTASFFDDQPEPERPRATRRSHSILNGHQGDFDRWYAAYPKKVAKGAAERAFLTAIKITSIECLVASAAAYATYVAGSERRFIQHPATWLNAKGWDDELPSEETTDARRLDSLSPAAQRRLDNLHRGLSTPSFADLQRDRE